MKKDPLENIQLESEAYHNLGLNDQIRVFNREVHAYEDKQRKCIVSTWEALQEQYISEKQLSELREQQLKLGFAQVLANLTGLMEAKNLYEAQLYHQSLLLALENSLTPSHRKRFLLLQSQAIGLTHQAVRVKGRMDSVYQELDDVGKALGDQATLLIKRAKRELSELSQIKEVGLFEHKKRQYLQTLADIHEKTDARSALNKQVDDRVEQARHCAELLFDARSSYLEDAHNWTQQAAELSEKGWLGLGSGLAVTPAALCIAIPALIGGSIVAPAVALGLGLAGAVYGAVDLGRTTATAISRETTVKLGARSAANAASKKESMQRFAKKALPIVLCVIGAAVAVAAVVSTGGVLGIVLAGAGVAVSGSGVALMAKAKYNQRKQLKAIQAKHKAVNKPFPKQESTAAETGSDSIRKSMRLIQGHRLDEQNLKQLSESMEEEEREEKSDKLSKTLQPKESIKEKYQDEELMDEEEGEGESGESAANDDDDQIKPPTPHL